MSKKRKPVQILGPDGRPYVKPEPPKDESPKVTVTFDTARVSDHTGYLSSSSLWKSMYGSVFGTNPYWAALAGKPDTSPLRAAVAEQVEALTADFEGTGGEELPAPPKDLTTYRDAYASAAAKCDHQDAVEIMYGREWLCESCNRMLNRADMRKAGWSRWG